MIYNLASPENFTQEQEEFVESFKNAINILSSQTGLIFGLKDIYSKHIISTDSYAYLVALSKGKDVAGRFDCDMPCQGTARFAQSFVAEDQDLLNYKDANRKKSILKIHEFAPGLAAIIFNKYPLKHQASQSILGVVYTAHEIEISNFITLIPNYLLEFGMGSSIEKIKGPLKIGNAKFTEYEQEVCFFTTMNWNCKQILHFINKHRPLSKPREVDTIYKCKDRICQKLNCELPYLRDALIHVGLHKKMPSLLFNRLIGSRLLS